VGPGPEGPEWAFNVGIRTVLIDCRTAKAYYGTGGGITYDSEPADEYAEARLKAEVLTDRRATCASWRRLAGIPHLGARHLDRHLGAPPPPPAYFDIPFDPAEVRAAIARAVKERSDTGALRILVDREGWVSVEVGESRRTPGPVRLVIDDRPIDRNRPFLYHKTTIRDAYTRLPPATRCGRRRVVERCRGGHRDHDRKPGLRSTESGSLPR
jgi:para-aminobenzoate synthetase / 4-amino-4-deoxychorismate lyase